MHEDVFRRLRAQFPAGHGVAVLDLGAGDGAMSARLLEHGYTVEAVEIVPGRFQVAGVPCRPLDLNGEFAAGFERPFDGIVAIDVIEHLENPRDFLRNCARLLAPGGLALVTSPNVECWNSRLIFLRHGTLFMFGNPEHDRHGHITPLFSWQVPGIAAATGLELAECVPAGCVPDWRLAWQRRGRISRLAMKAVLQMILFPAMKGPRKGGTTLYVFRKAGAP
ncbi:MAG: class I SAM-dependent methyltransferase [Kiritimatiellae bacterium]|nr:class I SAM-dependent methyltransferase [Kiritimatiellia bacterium]